jgi:dolichyl-phosphate beta-glucosyltransferase
MVDLSVVLPSYNEARTIARSLAALRAHLDAGAARPRARKSWEIIVVDDGSSDATATEALAVAGRDPRVRVLAMMGNAGKGGAVRAGVLASLGRIVIVTDADLSYALDDLDRAADALSDGEGGAGGLDMVVGDRRLAGSSTHTLPTAARHVLWRGRTSSVFNFCVRALYRLPSGDTQCGLKGFRRNAAMAIMPRLRTQRFLADIEMFLIARELGLCVGRIPVNVSYLTADSTVNVARHLPSAVADAFRIKLAQTLGRYRRTEFPAGPAAIERTGGSREME